MNSDRRADAIIIDDTESGKKHLIPSRNINPEELKILCFTLTYYSKTTQFLLSCTGVFVLYLIYGYMQELIFTLEGFKPYGWFLTLIQFFYYIIFGVCEHKIIKTNKRRCIPMKTYIILAGLTLGTMGLSNASLGYLNYPTQVIFKCCKLIPVLIGSILIQGKKHGPLDFIAAAAMCIGLTLFTLADLEISPNFNTFGIAMISMALVCDAAIGNVQEKAMREYNAPGSEVVLYSYGLGFVYLLTVMVLTGNFTSGFLFSLKYPVQTFGYAFLFSLSGYLGMQFVLALVRSSGAPIAATVTTARKAVTIAVSFIFFSKPFTMQYLWSGLIVVFGIYMNVYSKRQQISFSHLVAYWKKSMHIFGSHSNKKLLLEV